MAIKDYKELGFNTWLEKEGSVFSDFKGIQFYKTTEEDDEGNVIENSLSGGLVTLQTDKLGSQEVKEKLSQFKTLSGGDITQPINVVFGHIQSANFVTGASGAGWRIDSDGNLEANSGTFRGAIAATSGTIAAFTIASTTISATNLTLTSGAANTANISVGTGSNIAGMNSGNAAGDIAFWAGDTHANRASAPFRVEMDGSVVGSDITVTGGAISGTPISSIPNNSTTDISLLEFSHDLVFSVTDADTIAWATGTITLSNGRSFTIDAGNTGNMVALTYIFLDPGTSETVLQTTTTFSNAIGADKTLIGVAQNQTVTASFIPQSGGGKALVDGEQIGALSIIAGNIAATTITAGKMNVSTLSSIVADIGSITAGSISVVNGANTIGLTPSGTNAIFSGTTGSPEFKVTPAGALTATDATITGTIETATGTGARIEISSANNNLILFDSSNNDILNFGSISSIVLRILPASDASAILAQNASGVVLVQPLVDIDVQNTSSTAVGLRLVNVGSGDALEITQNTTAATCLQINNSVTGVTLHLNKSNTSTGTVLDLDNSGTGISLDIQNTSTGISMLLNKSGTGAGTVIDLDNAGTGISLDIAQTSTSNSGIALLVVNDGSGRTVSFDQNNTSATTEALYAENSGTGYTATFAAISKAGRTNAVILLSQANLTSTNFRNLIREDNTGTQIWVSDGTSPDTNLSAIAGDICLNGDSGNIYRCTGTTNWTAM